MNSSASRVRPVHFNRSYRPAQEPCRSGLEKDQFLPLGDNSPQSYDGRLWFPNYPHHYVHRDLLIGKALLIYWPHTWNRPVPFTPNFSKMGPIR